MKNNYRNMQGIMAITLLLLLVSGCGSVKVKRVDASTEVALTDRWNDADSKLVADEMIQDMLSYPWLKNFKKTYPNKVPTIVLQRVRNKSHEHLAVDTFVNDIKRAVLRNGTADFIASGAEREATRKELEQQDLHASAASRMEMGEEQGANFALSGSVNSMVDQLNGTRVTFYQVDLKLINLQSTREVWNGQKKIKKVQKKCKFCL